MPKHIHEIRDPIHVFIRLDSEERRVLDSRPFQRLRHIHQLALSYLIYPGATHKRFEHSLGVMELASRVFDIVTAESNRHAAIRDIFPAEDQLRYWRRLLRMAALCHDIGHLPFSHAAEHELLPAGWNHERITVELIRSDEMRQIWSNLVPPLDPERIAKLAVGKKRMPGTEFSDWEAILSEIIVGDAFGVDRIDYLLRDSYHSGVAYGRFDHYRLIDSLRILPKALDGSEEPSLGIQEGGVHSAEALLLARYFMYTQVYFHAIRRIYNIHLQDFMLAWLGKQGYPTALPSHLNLTDNEVLAEIARAASSSDHLGHDAARRIVERDHFRVLYQRNPADWNRNPDVGRIVFEAAKKQFGEPAIRYDTWKEKGESLAFPVEAKDGRLLSGLEMSDVLKSLPLAAVDFVFVEKFQHGPASEWLKKNRENIIGKNAEDES